LALVALILPAFIVLTTYPDRRLDMLYGETLVGQPGMWRQTLKTGDMGDRLTADLERLPQNAALAADWEQITILWYEQQVEGRRPDLEIFYPIDRYVEYLGERPVCLARHLPVDDAWHLTNVGPFVCLDDAPQTEPPPDILPIGTPYHNADGEPLLELVGARLPQPAVYDAASHVPLLLMWRALDAIPANYSVSLQILDEAWTPVQLSDGTTWQRDIQSPVMGLYPTSRWQPGEVVGDYHEISIPRDVAPGRYRWTVVVYTIDDAGQFIRLQDANGGFNIVGGEFEVRGR
jgi:hypothetical protein